MRVLLSEGKFLRELGRPGVRVRLVNAARSVLFQWWRGRVAIQGIGAQVGRGAGPFPELWCAPLSNEEPCLQAV